MAIGRIPEPLAGIQEAILDAKGDLISATAADTPARLAVGSNNQILMADSAQSTGLKWAASATSTLTAKGDLLTATAANTIARLGVGADGTTLVADSTQSTGLKWATASSTPTAVGVSATRSGAGFTVNAATYTAVTYDTEQWDTDNIHSNTTNTARFTVPTGKGGKWVLNVALLWAGISAAGSMRIGIYKNGSIIRRCQTTYFTGNLGEYDSPANEVLDLVAGDYIEIYAYQNCVASATCYGATTGTEKQGTAQFYYLGA